MSTMTMTAICLKMINYDIISTGSKGNAVVINGKLLIDCGVTYKALSSYVSGLKVVLLTHVHSDHFLKRTIKKLIKERPTLRFGCGRWLVPPLMDLGVPAKNIDILTDGTTYTYGRLFNVIPVPLVHDVPNQGYKVHFPTGEKMIYATDTGNLHGITAYHYDLFLIEANHDEEEIKRKIKEKQVEREFPYEKRAAWTHLSVQKANDFIYKNAKPTSEYVYMHAHQEEDDDNADNSENSQI